MRLPFDVVQVVLFWYGPLTLAAVVLAVVAAVDALAGDRRTRRAQRFGEPILLTLWASAIAIAVLLRFDRTDWVHLFWSAQAPLVGLFLGSGSLLVRTWTGRAIAGPV